MNYYQTDSAGGRVAFFRFASVTDRSVPAAVPIFPLNTTFTRYIPIVSCLLQLTGVFQASSQGKQAPAGKELRPSCGKLKPILPSETQVQ